jgi:hypothetical protein
VNKRRLLWLSCGTLTRIRLQACSLSQSGVDGYETRPQGPTRYLLRCAAQYCRASRRNRKLHVLVGSSVKHGRWLRQREPGRVLQLQCDTLCHSESHKGNGQAVILSEHDSEHRGKGNLLRKRVWCSYCSRLCYTEVLTRSSSTTDEAFLSAMHTYHIDDAGSKRMTTSLPRITMPIEETHVICSRTMFVRIPRQFSKENNP